MIDCIAQPLVVRVNGDAIVRTHVQSFYEGMSRLDAAVYDFVRIYGISRSTAGKKRIDDHAS